jgi:WhiB family redox-sensing transcriptional regulator
VTRHGNWRDQAACGDTDPDLFFPIGTTGPALRQIDEAKRICQGCPARTPCLDWALNHGVAFGIWGGTTEEERRILRTAPVRSAILANQRRPVAPETSLGVRDLVQPERSRLGF